MEYITRVYDAEELGRVQALLHAKGIPTHAVQEESQRMGAQWAVFVCLNDQVADALHLLRDPGHVPRRSVDAMGFERAMRAPDLGLLTRAATCMFLVAVPVLCGVIYVLWRYA